MVNKKDPASPAPVPVVPDLKSVVNPAVDLNDVPYTHIYENWDDALSGSSHRYEDYDVGEKINHVDGMTVEEAEHQIATRLYQNTAKVHFDAHGQKDSRFGKRLIYGGVVISIARALSFMRLVAVKDQDPGDFALRGEDGKYAPGVLLDFDYWAAIPRRA